MTTTEPKPCPFCGETVIYPTIYGSKEKLWGMLCDGCDLWIEGYKDEHSAIAAWNTRADHVVNANSCQRVLDKNGDLIGSKLEMKLRSDWRKISNHHGVVPNGVLEADIVRAFLAAITSLKGTI